MSCLQPALQLALSPPHQAGGQLDRDGKVSASYVAVNCGTTQSSYVFDLFASQNAINRHGYSCF